MKLQAKKELGQHLNDTFMKNKITYIIDDDKLTLKLTSIIINKNNFCKEAIPFSNPQIALDRLKENFNDALNLPDIIFLDLNMPIIDGWQFLNEFIQIPFIKEIAVFIVSSSIDPADIERARNYKIVKNYIAKPLTANKLKETSELLLVI
ncbi:response regulator [Flavobacterium faecale]|uniref:response regulator n=1 Tax=Flavobacterium faecale TaxID=1355330 RepID=UPI003AAD2265